MAEGRTGRSRAYADCLHCNDVHTVPDTPASANRWASKHADRNPGHQVHVTTERVRVYQSRAAEPG